MNFLTSLRTLLLALILSIGISYAYAAWTAPTANPPGGNIDAPVNVGGGSQTKAGPLWSDLFIGSSAGGYFGGNLQVAGNIQVPTLCLSGDCKSAWPVGGVTSIIPGSGISVDQGTGNVTITNTGGSVTKTPTVYRCPPVTYPTVCTGGITTDCGPLSLNTTCNVTGTGCPWPQVTRSQNYSCSFAGYLVQ